MSQSKDMTAKVDAAANELFKQLDTNGSGDLDGTELTNWAKAQGETNVQTFVSGLLKNFDSDKNKAISRKEFTSIVYENIDPEDYHLLVDVMAEFVAFLKTHSSEGKKSESKVTKDILGKDGYKVTGSTVNALATLYKSLDADGSGELSLEEYRDYIKVVTGGLQDKALQKEAEAQFALHDSDGDKTVSLVEFVAQSCRDVSGPSTEKHLVAFVRLLQKQVDSKRTLRGTHETEHKLRPGTRDLFAKIFKALDSDGNGSLNPSEFTKLAAACHRSEGDETSKFFSSFDSDKDAKVTLDEMTAKFTSGVPSSQEDLLVGLMEAMYLRVSEGVDAPKDKQEVREN